MGVRFEAPLLLLSILLLVSHGPLRSVALSIPRKYDGFVYTGITTASSIMVEAFVDPVCPDSRDTWAPLVKIVDHYSPLVSLIVHPFPLPYHDNSFLSCRALHIANGINESATFPLLELFFEQQTKFYNDQTSNLPKATIIKKMVDLAAAVVGNSSKATFEDGFYESGSDTAARISFKYGCSRVVTGTPYFFVNGFALPNGGSPISYNGWRSIIDPLVQDSDE